MGDPTRDSDTQQSPSQQQEQARQRVQELERQLAEARAQAGINPAGTGGATTQDEMRAASQAQAQAAAEARRERFDETVPGGHYIGPDGRAHDAHGNVKDDVTELKVGGGQPRASEGADRSERAAARARGLDAGEPGRHAGTDPIEALQKRIEAEKNRQTMPLTASEQSLRGVTQPIGLAGEPASIEDVQSGKVETTVGADVPPQGGASPQAAEKSKSVSRTRSNA